jgi:hypothetical protein
MKPLRPVLGALLMAVALVAAGCGDQKTYSDGRIASALDLKRAGAAYEVGGDPFCTTSQLLNDADEVDGAGDEGGAGFVIAGPGGEVGILAVRPFAPDCSRRARGDLKRLERKG